MDPDWTTLARWSETNFIRVPTVQVVNYFLSLDIKLTEVYGMSESTGIHTLNPPGKIKFGSVGVNSDVTVKSKLVKVRLSAFTQ